MRNTPKQERFTSCFLSFVSLQHVHARTLHGSSNTDGHGRDWEALFMINGKEKPKKTLVVLCLSPVWGTFIFRWDGSIHIIMPRGTR